VQHALLKIMEGAKVRLHDGRYVDTTDVLFVCGGAFVGLAEIMAQTKSLGYIATKDDDNRRSSSASTRTSSPPTCSPTG